MLASPRPLSFAHAPRGRTQLDADQFPELCDRFEIESVPAFLFLHAGQLTDSLLGATAPDLVGKVRENAITASIHNEEPSSAASAGAEPTPAPVPLDTRLAALVRRSPVMLFMKGSPDAPRCGFSRQITEMLAAENVKFDSFDILSDEEVRQGLKTFSNWPTFPQLYADGKLLGGLDVVKELQEEGELLEALPAAALPLDTRLAALVRRSPVMLFMKGSPDAPRCGFSRQITEMLQAEKVKFDSFDILSDEEVRQGLKTFSNWPTFPQLYADGKLLGGLDVVKELQEEGELLEALPAAAIGQAS